MKIYNHGKLNLDKPQSTQSCEMRGPTITEPKRLEGGITPNTIQSEDNIFKCLMYYSKQTLVRIKSNGLWPLRLMMPQQGKLREIFISIVLSKDSHGKRFIWPELLLPKHEQEFAFCLNFVQHDKEMQAGCPLSIIFLCKNLDRQTFSKH